jgi:hypothetical protein
MSFLYIKGKVYHCDTCGNSLKVEYQGGSKYTQIGDMNIIDQMELNQKYNSPDYDSEKYGYFFYFEDLICQDCFDKNYRKLDNINILSKDNPIDKFCYLKTNTDKLLKKLIEDILNSLVNDISIEDLKTINNYNYNQTILSKYFKLTFKKKELLNDFLCKSEKEIEQYFINMINEDARIIKLSKDYTNIISEITPEILSIINRNKENKYYYELNSSDTDNLNPYITTESSIRTPVELQKQYKLYEGPLELDFVNIKHNLNIASVDAMVKSFHNIYKENIKILEKSLCEKLGLENI